MFGVAADAAIGDPRRGHPVALFGRAAAAIERRFWADSRQRGAAYAATTVGAAIVLGVLVERLAQQLLHMGSDRRYDVVGPRYGGLVDKIAEASIVVAATWAVLGGRGLATEGAAMGAYLSDGDLSAARARLGHLCGRDPTALDADELARATVESIAENTSDAVVAPLWWGALAGVPGLVGYRAVNTLDAMVGHRSTRYARFGWAVARLDDAANLIPARLTGLLAAAMAPLVGGSLLHATHILVRDGANHPSPNAGHCEAAFAGALDRRLGGRNVYGDRVEVRGTLGEGPTPTAADVVRAVRLSRAITVGTVVVVGLLGTVGRVGSVGTVAAAVRRRFR